MELPIIDWEISKKLAGNNLEHAKEFLELLIKELKKELPLLRDHLQNTPDFKRRLHKLKGALSYTGLERLKVLTNSLENSLKNKQCIIYLFEEFEQEVNNVIQHVVNHCPEAKLMSSTML